MGVDYSLIKYIYIRRKNLYNKSYLIIVDDDRRQTLYKCLCSNIYICIYKERMHSRMSITGRNLAFVKR